MTRRRRRPWKIRFIPLNCWPRSITASGFIPETIVYNHLNQPRELVKAQALTQLLT